MALPSSPPVSVEQFISPPEHSIPSSPPPLPLPLSLPGAASRKRQFSDYGSQSSDPVFSDATTDSEQHPAARDPGRKKRFVTGRWWSLPRRESANVPTSSKRQNPLRNADSGVWMGSDEDLTSSDFSSSLPADVPRTAESRNAAFGVTAPVNVPESEVLAAATIRQCVDESKETVSLSNMHLRALSAASLAPLHHLIRSSPGDSTHPPSEDEFVPLIPSIQLFLYSNKLTQIPSEVFNLANITVLSLRNNELDSVPPAIARLPRLKELNVSGNRIPYLPFEIVSLLSPSASRQITLRPNPLLSLLDFQQHSFELPLAARATRECLPGASVDPHALQHALQDDISEHADLNVRIELEIRRMVGSACMSQRAAAGPDVSQECELLFLASSAVRYFNVNGTLAISARALKSASTPDWTAELKHSPPSQAASSATASLFELALRALQRVDTHEALAAMTNPGTPDHVLKPIQQATENKDRRYNSICTTCQRDYIIPRAEWMEYWFYGTGSQLTNGSVFPFLRQACSWSCATPSKVGDFQL